MKLNYGIPDLSELRELSTLAAMNCIFRGAGPKDHQTYALTLNFIRLIELSIREYESARGMVARFAATTKSAGFNYMVTASGNFEVCVDALKRAVNHLKRIRAHPHAPASLIRLLPRNTKVLTGRVEGQVTDMRNAIQHLEKDILEGRVVHGQALALFPGDDGIELGGQKILYTDLSDWLRELHGRASALANYWET
ncbi:MAG: hypothetical protein ACYTEL_06575 [Planctomycetota bacterium]|jgi:hypothetical protein